GVDVRQGHAGLVEDVGHRRRQGLGVLSTAGGPDGGPGAVGGGDRHADELGGGLDGQQDHRLPTVPFRLAVQEAKASASDAHRPAQTAPPPVTVTVRTSSSPSTGRASATVSAPGPNTAAPPSPHSTRATAPS